MAAFASPGRRRAGPALALGVLLALSACLRPGALERAMQRAEGLARSTQMLAADGSVLATLHAGENRQEIAITQVPDHVRKAVVAVEDARFYRHAGIDGKAILRALAANSAEGRTVQGGSTITQQYVKNALLESRERTFKRKIREATLAMEIERRYSKDEILERYLNTVYFGQGAYGIQAAALTFFGKPARSLDLHEGALLAGLIKAPARYDPFSDPPGALGRRNFVLSRMREEGFVEDAAAADARERPLRLTPRRTGARYEAAYFVDYVKEIVQEDPQFRALGRTRADRIHSLFKGGLRIETTLDPRLQRIAEEESRRVLSHRDDPHNAFVAMDPRDGSLRAMVGGRDFFSESDPNAKFNLATKSRRQSGSAFKTFALVAALEEGISLDRMLPGSSGITIRTPSGPWQVSNYGNIGYGPVSLRRATSHSVNVAYASLVDEIGPQAVIHAAERMGITSRLRSVHSIVLGTQEVSPLEMAVAYSAIANGGRRVAPVAIRRIIDGDGRVLYEAEVKPKKVVDPLPIASAVDALQGVMKRGTGSRLQIGRPAAGKTGTTEEFRDAWFAGFVPQLVGVSWVGFPRKQISMKPPNTRIRVVGGSWPGQIWQGFMIRALRNEPIEPWPIDVGKLLRVRVDATRGCLPNRYTPPALIKERLFVEGKEPKEICAEPSSPDIDTPSVLGLGRNAAVERLERAGFVVTVRRRACPAFPPGQVCEQRPEPAEAARVGDAADIVISDDGATARVPMVLGQRESSAREELEDEGFDVSVIRKDNAPVSSEGCRDVGEERSGRVWLQYPCAGTDWGAGGLVRLYVNP